MRTLPYFETPLTTGTGEGLATHDPRLAHITRLAESDQIEQAAAAAAELSNEGILDIRLIVFEVYAVFTQEGVAQLPVLLDGLQRLLATSFERIGPAERRDVHCAKSMAWLFNRIEATLGYHRAKQDETWARWVATGDAIDASITVLEALIAPRQRHRALQEPGAKLRRLLRELSRDASPALEMVAADPPPTTPLPPPTRREHTFELEGSACLKELIDKLRAFETLTRHGDFPKAALVAADVQATIDNFDPREYFPRLFATFSALLAEHVDRIAPHWEQKDSVGWRTLEQFYRVDLDAFVGESDQ